MTKALTTILCVFFMPILFVSCSSTPSISENATATQLIQMGQDALDIGNYKAAETCYKAVIEKYGEDINLYIEARYELGHMYLTRKKYGEAYAIFFRNSFDLRQYGIRKNSWNFQETCTNRNRQDSPKTQTELSFSRKSKRLFPTALKFSAQSSEQSVKRIIGVTVSCKHIACPHQFIGICGSHYRKNDNFFP